MEEKGDPESQNYMVSTIQPFDGTPRFQTVLQFLPRHSCSCISGHRGQCVVGVIIHSRGRSRELKKVFLRHAGRHSLLKCLDATKFVC